MAAPAFPGLEAIKDQPTKQAVRLIWERIAVIETLAKGPTEGTLSPDTKPANLSLVDAGTLFFSTDFNRMYRWTGSSWTDDATAPARFDVSFFASPPEPAVGWLRCDGRSGNRSTSTGGIAFYETPVIPVLYGLLAYIRT